MIQSLYIKNYALIEELNVNFKNGYCIITGETGAGKSILLGALGLIAGDRSDTQALRDKTKKCIVESNFSIDGYKLQPFFEANELDYSPNTVIRREINADGKSRAFVNDTPVNVSVLKLLADYLIDIHSQHQTLSLNNSIFQLSLIDVFAENSDLIATYKNDFTKYKQASEKLNELIEKDKQAKKEYDYIKFQFEELNSAALKVNEQQELEQEQQTLEHAETIKSAIVRAVQNLSGGEENLISQLGAIKSSIQSVSKYNSNLNDILTRLSSVHIELKDIGNELDNLESEIIYDPQKIEEINERLDLLYKLQNKHQVNNIEELLKVQTELDKKLSEFSSTEEDITKTEKLVNEYQQRLNKQASTLSDRRKKSIPKIESKVSELLSNLAMPNAQLKIEQTHTETFTSTGIDKINFLFSANKGSDFKEIQKVASGGELSRLMLSLKYMMAKSKSLPTIIFDEIDTGISGAVAAKVADIMKEMGESMQVIAITHLPQIASKGQYHYFVYKETTKDTTYTNLKELSKNERVEEIAKMLSNGTVSDTSIKNAKELLK